MSHSRRRALSLLGSSTVFAGLPSLLQAQTQALPVLTIGSSLADDLTPAIYALRTGIFKRMGLDVQLQISASGAALSAAVVGGTIDVGKSTLLGLITAYAHGIHFKLVAGAGVFDATAPTGQLMVLNNSPVKSMADANGKTIALAALKSLDQLSVQALIDKQGGNSSTVNFVEVSYTLMLPALEAGRIDIASIATPAMEAALATGKVRLLGPPYAAFGDHYMFAAWFCTAAYAAQNPVSVRRFTEAMRESSTYTNAHPGDTVSMLSDYTHVDPALIAKMHRLNSATTLDSAGIQRLIDAAYRYRLIDKSFPAGELLV